MHSEHESEGHEHDIETGTAEATEPTDGDGADLAAEAAAREGAGNAPAWWALWGRVRGYLVSATDRGAPNQEMPKVVEEAARDGLDVGPLSTWVPTPADRSRLERGRRSVIAASEPDAPADALQRAMADLGGEGPEWELVRTLAAGWVEGRRAGLSSDADTRRPRRDRRDRPRREDGPRRDDGPRREDAPRRAEGRRDERGRDDRATEARAPRDADGEGQRPEGRRDDEDRRRRRSRPPRGRWACASGVEWSRDVETISLVVFVRAGGDGGCVGGVALRHDEASLGPVPDWASLAADEGALGQAIAQLQGASFALPFGGTFTGAIAPTDAVGLALKSLIDNGLAQQGPDCAIDGVVIGAEPPIVTGSAARWSSVRLHGANAEDLPGLAGWAELVAALIGADPAAPQDRARIERVDTVLAAPLDDLLALQRAGAMLHEDSEAALRFLDGRSGAIRERLAAAFAAELDASATLRASLRLALDAAAAGGDMARARSEATRLGKLAPKALSDAPPATAVVLALADLEDPARCDAAVERLALLLPGLPASSLRTTAALTLARAQVASLDGDGAEAATALLGSDADPTETALLRAEIAALRGQFRTADTLAAEADREGAATAVRGRARALRASVTALAHAVPEAGEEPLLPEGSADASADVRPRAACAATHSERLREAVPTASESVIAAAEAFGEQDLPVEQHAALLRALWFRDDLGDAEAAYVARRERWPESGPVVDCLRGLLLYASGRDKDAARRFRRAARSAEGRSTPDRRLRALVAATGACATGRDDLRSTALAALGGDNWPLAASIREAAERGDADRLDTLAALLPLS